MRDPVIVFEDCMTYERAAISQWFSGGKTTSPSTGNTLASTDFGPNHQLRQSIEEFLRRRPALPSRRAAPGSKHLVAVRAQIGAPNTWSTDEVPVVTPSKHHDAL